MDTTKQYLLMCEKAKEIQQYAIDNWINLRPLFIYDKLLNKICICVWFPKTLRNLCNLKQDEHIISIEQNNDIGVYIPEGTLGDVIWLPRQDQLQDILKDTHWTIYGYLEQITKFMSDYGSIDWSWEQVWLGFAMKEKYNKVWNGLVYVEQEVKVCESMCDHIMVVDDPVSGIIACVKCGHVEYLGKRI